MISIEPLESRLYPAVSFTHGVLRVTGTAGNDNLSIETRSGLVRVLANGVPSQQFQASKIKRILIDARAGSDTVNGPTNIPARIRGGDGNDILNAGPGNDTILGGPGDDQIDPGLGADQVDGGEGDDLATYASRTAPLSITLDTSGGDGEAGEDDTLLGVEDVTGGQGDDLLRGDAKANTLNGQPGRDTLQGLGGNDLLIGGDDSDTMRGGAGRDRLVGNYPFDDDSQSATADFFDGGKGFDRANSGAVDTLVSIEGELPLPPI
jgi:hypothetical protein